ncbi:uncharacterized protein PgNI_05054 [Pyricularia grisea]|uniref:Carboxylesterase type B domain-containing protein n=1 Tax=Pyricularia grisea TaxID=148305 RepID=A0A6P8BE94_PYRGI|nr:uncharacterized protein PgNI_05054 [Pyricularia grisea]TLD14017.1 hypothetical protein PgNI_05054 [Pyricularia grisea]
MTYQQQIYTFDASRLTLTEGLTVVLDDEPVNRYFGSLPYVLPPTANRGIQIRHGFEPGSIHWWDGNFSTASSANSTNQALFHEDCLQLNIRIYAEPTLKQGWPVVAYLHRGFLQPGSFN